MGSKMTLIWRSSPSSPAALVWSETLQLQAWGRSDAQGHPKCTVPWECQCPWGIRTQRDASLDPALGLEERKQSPK